MPPSKSNPQALVAPIFSCRTQAVDGKNISGVTVATMIRSISSAPIPLCSRTFRAAPSARALVGVPFSTIRRSRIPVRSKIHWSVVSTIASKSWFVRRPSGRWWAMAVMVALVSDKVSLSSIQYCCCPKPSERLTVTHSTVIVVRIEAAGARN